LLDGLKIQKAIGLVWRAASQWAAINVMLLFLQSLIPLATLYIFKLIVDLLTDLNTPSANHENIILLLVSVLGLALIGNACSAVLSHINVIQTYLVSDYMQRLIQSKSIEMDLAFYENPQAYAKLHRAQREAPSRPLRIVQGISELGRNGLTLLGSILVLATFHWGVVSTLLAASLPILFFRLKHVEALYQLHSDTTAKQRLSNYLNRILTTAEHAKEVRAFGYGQRLAEKFNAVKFDIRAGLRQLSAQGAWKEFITEATAACVGFGVFSLIVFSALEESISLGKMVMYIGAFQVAVGTLRPTLRAISELYENNLFLSTLYEFFEVPSAVSEPEKSKKMPHPWRIGLKITNLGFQYPGTEARVLEDINITISPGETVALVGRNGSGKTTLTKLICRLYDPDSGSISVDGIDLCEFRLADIRREMSVIFQDFGRYHLTARENIALGRPEEDLNDHVVYHAAQSTGIHEILVGLPQGYDTVMGRDLVDGAELSIGQWQKLALARAFVRDAQLFLLDEPTSSLDPVAEFDFFQRFREMTQGKAALIISHRFSTVQLADRIYVLDKGRLVETGTHRELIAIGGLYANLYGQQASYYRDVTGIHKPGVTV
jgi:ATP-binding cassette subfamily B protein